MDDYFNVEVSDPGQEYWNMDPIAPTWNDELSWGDNGQSYEYDNYDFQGPTYDEMGYGQPEIMSPSRGYGPGTGYDNGSGGMNAAYDEEGNLMPGYALDENNNPQWQGGDYSGTGAEYGQQGPYYGNQPGMPGQPPRAQQPGYGQQPQQRQQPGQPQQNKGLLGGLFGGGGGGGGGGFGDILGTLGGLALVGGVGALLGSMLSNKSSGGGTPSPISMPGSNLTPTKLATPGMNPGYAMGASAAPVMGSTTSNLGKLISPGAIAPIPPGMM